MVCFSSFFSFGILCQGRYLFYFILYANILVNIYFLDFFNAKNQVLLLDEPTNHLDVNAVKWLTDYLTSLKDVTVITVSHDTQFLEDVVTDVLHYESLKLVPYAGGLKHFISLKPEAK